jgi:hypothetical protein
VIVPVLRSVARRRLAKTGNSSACVAVNWKVCKSVIALYFLCSNVIKIGVVTKGLISPIIRNVTRNFRRPYHTTLVNIATFQSIARHWLDKHPAIHARNNRTNVYCSLLGNSQRANGLEI